MNQTNTVVMLLVQRRVQHSQESLLNQEEEMDMKKIEGSLRAGVTLLPFFAVNWFLSVLALENTDTTAFQYIFAISNAVFYFLVFLFFCHQAKVKPPSAVSTLHFLVSFVPIRLFIIKGPLNYVVFDSPFTQKNSSVVLECL